MLRADECQASIFYTPREFQFWLPLFTNACLAFNYRPGKGGWAFRLFVVLNFAKQNCKYLDLQLTTNVSASSLWKIVRHCTPVFLNVLKTFMANLFPNAAEREYLATSCVPAALKGLGIFGSVDTTKRICMDSVDPQTNTLHYNIKGFGLFCMFIVDNVGNIIFIVSINFEKLQP
jgi:hypothetical protein